MNSGPWGNWNPQSQKPNQGGSNQGGSNNSNQDKNSQQEPKKNPNEKDFFEKLKKKFSDFFEENFNSNKSFKDYFNKDNNQKPLFGLIILGVILLWLSFGIYKVNSHENAIVLYFGKYYKTATPGLNYYIPFPFGKVIKKSVTTVNTEEFGFFSQDNRSNRKRNLEAESLMLTGDENIVDIEFQIQWQIADIKDYSFNIEEPNQSIRKSAESAMREIIARTPIANALSDGKSKIELETKVLLQEILDSYKSGVRIVLVQLRRVDPPSQVIDAFRDVQTAKADKEKEINEAQAYANDIIPRARGAASKISEDAEAYAQEIIANSEGEAERFVSVYKQYSRAKQVTKKRMYIETMEKVYRDMDKILIDNSSKSSLMTYLPINDFKKSGKKND